MLKCIRTAAFMHDHAPSMRQGVFPEISVRDACVRDSEAHSLCVALAKEIQEVMGEHNGHNLRPFASVAAKLVEMRGAALRSCQSQIFDRFDLDAFLEESAGVGCLQMETMPAPALAEVEAQTPGGVVKPPQSHSDAASEHTSSTEPQPPWRAAEMRLMLDRLGSVDFIGRYAPWMQPRCFPDLRSVGDLSAQFPGAEEFCIDLSMELFLCCEGAPSMQTASTVAAKLVEMRCYAERAQQSQVFDQFDLEAFMAKTAGGRGPEGRESTAVATVLPTAIAAAAATTSATAAAALAKRQKRLSAVSVPTLAFPAPSAPTLSCPQPPVAAATFPYPGHSMPALVCAGSTVPTLSNPGPPVVVAPLCAAGPSTPTPTSPSAAVATLCAPGPSPTDVGSPPVPVLSGSQPKPSWASFGDVHGRPLGGLGGLGGLSFTFASEEARIRSSALAAKETLSAAAGEAGRGSAPAGRGRKRAHAGRGRGGKPGTGGRGEAKGGRGMGSQSDTGGGGEANGGHAGGRLQGDAALPGGAYGEPGAWGAGPAHDTDSSANGGLGGGALSGEGGTGGATASGGVNGGASSGGGVNGGASSGGGVNGDARYGEGDLDASCGADVPLSCDAAYVPPVRGHRTLRFQPRILNPYLVCTLCMGYYNDATTIIECLHTFCRSCISRHLRDCSECPECGCGLGPNPKELLRMDRTLQAIVNKVFPHLEPPLVCSTPAAPASQRIKRKTTPGGRGRGGRGAGGRAKPGRGRGGRSAAHPAEAPTSGDAAATPTDCPAEVGGGCGGAAAGAEISFSLHDPSGTTRPLDKPFLRTSTRMTVAHLQKHLSKKVLLQNGSHPSCLEASADGSAPGHIDILCRNVPMPAELSLEAIAREHWRDPGEDLVLEYRLVGPATMSDL